MPQNSKATTTYLNKDDSYTPIFLMVKKGIDHKLSHHADSKNAIPNSQHPI